MIAKPGEGFKLAMKTLDGGRIGVAAQGLGIAKGAFEIARKYLMDREQFGKPLYKQQYLAFQDGRAVARTLKWRSCCSIKAAML